MDPKQREQYLIQLEQMHRLESLMVHPEWPFLDQLLQDELHFHQAKVKNPAFRQDPSQYPNVIRALDAADVVQGFISKLERIIRTGRKAQEEISREDGRTTQD